jgi:hypothetical protein
MYPTPERARSCANFLAGIESDLHLQAHQLVQRFRDICDGLITNQREIAAREGLARNRKPAKVWMPLRFRVLETGPYFYLEWYATAPGTKPGRFFTSRIPRTVPASGYSNYSIQTLLSRAPEYMHCVVHETETEARFLRERLKLLANTKKLTARLLSPP